MKGFLLFGNELIISSSASKSVVKFGKVGISIIFSLPIHK